MGGKGSGRIPTKCVHNLAQSYCKTCRQVKDRKRQKRQPRNSLSSRNLVRQYKLSLKHCIICKIKINDTNYMMFALDHRDPTQKLFNLSQANCALRHLVLPECQKCDLMCHNCHHLKTHKSGDHKIRKEQTTAKVKYPPLLELMYGID